MNEPKKSVRYEFGGIPGNLGLIIGLPILTYYLYFCIRFNNGAIIPGPECDVNGFFGNIIPTWTAAIMYGVWFLLLAVLQEKAPGKVVRGTELVKGGQLEYKINGMFSMWFSFGLLFLLHITGLFTLDVIYDEFGALISVTTIFSTVLSVWLYFYGKKVDPYKLSGNPIHDFWMGTGLNPRWPDPVKGFDFKFFCEGRPGLIGWMVLNVSLAYVQYQKYGFLSFAMVLVLIMQFIYIFNYFQKESFVLTTMDIKHEKFGFMLIFGDLVWVPYLYCLQAFYLIDHVHNLPWWGGVLIILFNITGYILFRESNLQKDRFKLDPDNAVIWGEKPEYLETKIGSKLLISGFWGWARHFNYLGDIMMALAWSLPCLFGSIVPYFYPIYFTILLIQRERRDNHLCKEKYQEDWDRYCEKVRWRILPGIY